MSKCIGKVGTPGLIIDKKLKFWKSYLLMLGLKMQCSKIYWLIDKWNVTSFSLAFICNLRSFEFNVPVAESLSLANCNLS